MRLSRILIYPIKSLDGISVSEARVTSGGILEHDRAHAIVDEHDSFVNAKRCPSVHALRCSYSPDFREVCIEGESFVLAEPDRLNRRLSDILGFAARLISEPQSGFPDDHKASGPTVVGETSLAEVASWFPGLETESVRRRFRANLELAGEDAVPFCEDRLYGAPDEQRPFSIGKVRLLGHNPCQRCAVPTRDPDNGSVWNGFQKTFMESRRKYLPAWADERRFNHYYRFTVNTSIPASEAGKWLRLGDACAVEPAP